MNGVETRVVRIGTPLKSRTRRGLTWTDPKVGATRSRYLQLAAGRPAILHRVEPEPEIQKQWAATWRAAGVALAGVRAEELRSTTPAQALQAAENLLSLASPPRDLPRWRSSGLVDQQRLFRRLRDR
jgi:hypothetical protein